MATEVREEKRKLTDAMCAKVKARSGKRTIYPDSETPGLELRVAPEGTRTFSLIYRVKGDRKLRRITIGEYIPTEQRPEPGEGVWTGTLEAAREVAWKHRGTARQSVDPIEQQQERVKAAQARRKHIFSAIAEAFIEDHVSKLASRHHTEAEIRRFFLGQKPKLKPGQRLKPGAKREWIDEPVAGTKDAKARIELSRSWRTRPIELIDEDDVSELIQAIKKDRGPHMARRALSHVKRLFRWAGAPARPREERIKNDPCLRLTAEKSFEIVPVERDVVLADPHLRLVWKAAEKLSDPRRSLCHTLILSGNRLNEIARMSWPEVNFAEKTVVIPAERMKGKPGKRKPHEIALSPAMFDILERIHKTRGKKGDYIFSTTDGTKPFSSFSKMKSMLDEEVAKLRAEELEEARQRGEEVYETDLVEWTLHDLRRTMRTGLGAIPSITLDIREKVIAHIPPKIQRIYDVHAYRDEKRQALTLWAQRVARIIEPAPQGEKVVDLHRRPGATDLGSAL